MSRSTAVSCQRKGGLAKVCPDRNTVLSPASWIHREVSAASTKVGDFWVPKGVIVWPMQYALHNSQHNWEHPEEFRPERCAVLWRNESRL